MQKIANLVREVQEALEESETSAEVHALEQALREDQSALDALKRESRRVLLAAHRKVQASREQSDRGALRLSSPSAPPGTKVSAARQDQTQATSQDVQTALQRTVALMSSELEKSGYSAQLLEESSENLTQISESYASFGTLLHDSIDLIRQMERAELWDWAILVISLSFFVGCVSYILYVRVISRGLSLLGVLYRATSLAKRKGMSLAPFAHTASISAASVSTAFRRSPAEPPRKVLGHRESSIADAGRNLSNDPLSSVATKSSRARGARRGVDARRKAEAFRNAEEQALTEASEEETIDAHTQFGEDQAEELIQSIEARFSESSSESILDPLLRTLSDSPKTHSARKPRRKMGTVSSSPTTSSFGSQATDTKTSNTPSPTANAQDSFASDAPDPLQQDATTADPILSALSVDSESQDPHSQSMSHVTEPIQSGNPAADSNSLHLQHDTLTDASSSQPNPDGSIRPKSSSDIMPDRFNHQHELSYSDTASLPVTTKGSHTPASSDNDDQRPQDEGISLSLDGHTTSSASDIEKDALRSSIVSSDEDFASLSTTNPDQNSAHSPSDSEENSARLSNIQSEENSAPSSILDTQSGSVLSSNNNPQHQETPASAHLHDFSTSEEVAQLQTSHVKPQDTSVDSDEMPITAITPKQTSATIATFESSSVPTASNTKASQSRDHFQVIVALSSASASLRAAAPTLDPTMVDAMWKKLNSASDSLEKVMDSVYERSTAPSLSTSQITESISKEQGSVTSPPLLTKASVFGEQLMSRVVPEFAMNTQSSLSENSMQQTDEQDAFSEPSVTDHPMHDEL
ncbi:Protein transport protein sec20 [Malassezia yamatoensis]|uniref:Protein transport protein sec20 n=1 Tax=Malassezia yamatoensis TaxID=253288 RepID=A0AAJ5YN52_9BASI|nr:Protein transport protein sec20 [Malassezia yamatoensis]